MIIIGIDYATDVRKTGLALGSFQNNIIAIEDVKLGSKNEPPVEIILGWLHRSQLALLALDAPLGWPSALGQALSKHSAGRPVEAKAEYLFSRLTDHMVEENIGKRPLEVGANLIARTAYSALELLQELREKTGLEIPLAWQPGGIRGTSAIEVYPAATLTARNIRATSYKDKGAGKDRVEILKQLDLYVEKQESRRKLEESPDALDAVICVVAASDFLLERCIPVSDMEKAQKEGWIWVQQPKTKQIKAEIIRFEV